MDEVIEKNATMFIRASFIVVFFGTLTQLSGVVAFPSYNVALGFWGAYSGFSKSGKATFGFITFCAFSILLDIIFCFVNGHDSDGFRFSLSMLIFGIFAKVYALFTSSHFFASIGGASSLEDNMSASAYETLAGSADGTKSSSGGSYYPPNNMNTSSTVSQSTTAAGNRMSDIGKPVLLQSQLQQQQQQQVKKSNINTFTGMTDSGSF